MESLYPEKPLAGFYVTSLRGYAPLYPGEVGENRAGVKPPMRFVWGDQEIKEKGGMPPLYPGEVGENREGGRSPPRFVSCLQEAV